MDAIRILGEWTYQYNLLVEGLAAEYSGHWDIDEAMADFKGLITECCSECCRDYEVLTTKFKDLVANNQYAEAKVVGAELNKLITNAVLSKYPDT